MNRVKFKCTYWSEKQNKDYQLLDFPGGAMVKNLTANARNAGSSPGPGRSHMPQSS